MKEPKLDMERIYVEHTEFYPTSMVARHKARYEWAISKLSPVDIVLDICCGSGYGSDMISQKCEQVFGVDRNDDAIEYAKKNYVQPNLNYGKGDVTDTDVFGDIQYTAITWIEAIEHFTEKQAEAILVGLKKNLVHNGILILTTPDREQSEGKNEYHIKEYTAYEIKSLVRKYFKVEEIDIRDKFIYLVARNG